MSSSFELSSWSYQVDTTKLILPSWHYRAAGKERTRTLCFRFQFSSAFLHFRVYARNRQANWNWEARFFFTESLLWVFHFDLEFELIWIWTYLNLNLLIPNPKRITRGFSIKTHSLARSSDSLFSILSKRMNFVVSRSFGRYAEEASSWKWTEARRWPVANEKLITTL